MALTEKPHRRRNPLTGDWVLVSPQRNNRPWSGAVEAEVEKDLPIHDAACPLCPGNSRINGAKNPDYTSTYVFKNDFGALEQTPLKYDKSDESELMKTEATNGECRVICFSPDHNRSLPEMNTDEIHMVVNTWQENYLELIERYSCVHIFENKGEAMGCSQPHPHGQIWAHNHWSSEIEKEQRAQLGYFEKHGTNMLEDYILLEQEQQERIVLENTYWIVVVPYWAAWPFETLLISKQEVSHFGDLDDDQKRALADIIRRLTIKYDNIFNCSFPYSMGWHNAPANLSDNKHWRLHAHFYPPLLRSSTIKKHMVGYEMLGESQRDITAEIAAKILLDTSEQYYKKKRG